MYGLSVFFFPAHEPSRLTYRNVVNITSFTALASGSQRFSLLAVTSAQQALYPSLIAFNFSVSSMYYLLSY